MEKLERLTPEEEAYIPVLRKRYEDAFYKNEKLNIEVAEEGIEWLYKTYLGREKPIIMTMKSNLGCQILIHLLKNNLGANLGENLGENLGANLGENLGENLGANLGENLGKNLGKNLWANLGTNLGENLGDNLWTNLRANLWTNLRDNLGNDLGANLGENLWDNLGKNLWDNLGANLGDNLGDNLRDNLRDNLWTNLRDNLGDNLGAIKFERSSGYLNPSDYGWVAFYDMIQYTGHFKSYDFTDFNKFKKLLFSGVYEIYVFDKICIICEIPKVTQNSNNRLHNVDAPAVCWRDGYHQFFINGVELPEKTFISIKEKTFSMVDFMKESNEEKKSAILLMMEELYGSEYVFRFISEYLKDIDSYVDKKDDEYMEGTTRGMNIGVYTLFTGRVNDMRLSYVRCYCPSTDRMFFLSTRPDFDNAKDAIASLYQVPMDLANEIKYISRQGERFSTVFTEKGTELLKNKKVDFKKMVNISGERYFSLMRYEY